MSFYAQCALLITALIATSSAMCDRAVGQAVSGVSYYAIQGFSPSECSRALRVFDGVTTPGLVMLWGTFGTSNSCLRRYIESFDTVPHVLEVHITNNTCLRGGICRRGEIVRGVTPRRYNMLLESKNRQLVAALRTRVRRIVTSVANLRGASTRLLITTGLEDNYSPSAYQVVRSILVEARSITPFEIVRNPMRVRFQTVTNADFLEGHGFSPRIGPQWNGHCVANNDGDDISFKGRRKKGERTPVELIPYVNKYRAQGCLVFLWWSGAQGILPALGPRITPARRTILLRPSEISAINQVLVATQGNS